MIDWHFVDGLHGIVESGISFNRWMVDTWGRNELGNFRVYPLETTFSTLHVTCVCFMTLFIHFNLRGNIRERLDFFPGRHECEFVHHVLMEMFATTSSPNSRPEPRQLRLHKNRIQIDQKGCGSCELVGKKFRCDLQQSLL
jgi:hypothetical protein